MRLITKLEPEDTMRFEIAPLMPDGLDDARQLIQSLVTECLKEKRSTCAIVVDHVRVFVNDQLVGTVSMVMRYNRAYIIAQLNFEVSPARFTTLIPESARRYYLMNVNPDRVNTIWNIFNATYNELKQEN